MLRAPLGLRTRWDRRDISIGRFTQFRRAVLMLHSRSWARTPSCWSIVTMVQETIDCPVSR